MMTLGQEQIPDRRERLANFAKRSGIVIVEDEVYAPLLGTQPVPLVALAPTAVCYVTSFSKAVLPGLRIGYISAPLQIAERLRNAIRVSTWMPSPMLASLASRWVKDGTATRLIAKRREAGRVRIDVARRVLRRHKLSSRDDGRVRIQLVSSMGGAHGAVECTSRVWRFVSSSSSVWGF